VRHLHQLTAEPGPDLKAAAGVGHEMGQDELAVLPARRQACAQVDEGAGRSRLADEHQDPVLRRRAEPDPVRLRHIAPHQPVGVKDLNQRAGHGGGADRHDDHQRVQRPAENAQLQPDSQDHDLGQARVFISAARTPRAGRALQPAGRRRRPPRTCR